MENFIIILILLIAVGYGVISTVKHFQGKGACCGGGNSYKPRRKKRDHVIAKKTVCISGMSCDNCANRVMEAINRMEGASAVVSHKKGTAVVQLDRAIEDSVLKAAVEKAGYMVTDIH